MKIAFNQIIPILIFLMAFFLPLHMGASNLFLILFFVSSAYLFLIKKEYVLRSPKVLIYTLLPIFILYVLGTFYSSPAFVGVKIIGRNISFLLCPILILFHSQNMWSRIKTAMFKGIVVGSVLAVIILLVNNLLNYFATRPFPKFDDEILDYYYTYYNFTDFLDQHPSYFGVFVIFSMAILIIRLFKTSGKYTGFTGFALLVLSMGVLFLNSRIVFLFYMLLLLGTVICMGIRLYRRKKYMLLSLLLGVFISTTAIGVYLLSDTFIASRFTSELEWELSDQVDTTYNNKITADSRIARWDSALEVIGEKLFFGHGSYTEKDILAESYKKNGMMVSYTNRYDAHNLYLSFMVEFGIFGLVVLLFFLFSNIYFSLKYKDPAYFLLFFIICVISCFESYLKNNAAITFVVLFGGVFLYVNYFSKSNKVTDAKP